MLLSPFYGPHMASDFTTSSPGVFTTRPMNAFAFPSLDASLSSGVRFAWHRKCSIAEIHSPTSWDELWHKCPCKRRICIGKKLKAIYYICTLYIYIYYVYSKQRSLPGSLHFLEQIPMIGRGSKPICNWIFQVCKEKCGFIQTKAYHTSQTLQECPSWKKNIASEDLWLEDHPFLSQLCQSDAWDGISESLSTFLLPSPILKWKMHPQNSSKRSVWPVLIIPAECLLLIGLLTIAFPSVYFPPRMPVTNEGL